MLTNIYRETFGLGLSEKNFESLNLFLTKADRKLHTNRFLKDYSGVHFYFDELYSLFGRQNLKTILKEYEDLNLIKQTEERSEFGYRYLTFTLPTKFTKLGSKPITNKALIKSRNTYLNRLKAQANIGTKLTDIETALQNFIIRKNYTADETIIKLNPVIPFFAEDILKVDVNETEININELYEDYLQRRKKDKAKNEQRKRKKRFNTEDLTFEVFKESYTELIDIIHGFKNLEIGEALELIEKHVDKDLELHKNRLRIYTPFTNMNKGIRKHLTINGNSTVELDISACHPSILAKILPILTGNDNIDFTVFFNANIGDGNYYNALAKLLDMNVDDTKEYALKMLNCRETEKAHKTFCKLFPQAAEIVTAIKTCKDFKINKGLYKWSKKNKRYNIPNFHSNMSFILITEEVRIVTEIWHCLHNNNIAFIQTYDGIIVEIQNKD